MEEGQGEGRESLSRRCLLSVDVCKAKSFCWQRIGTSVSTCPLLSGRWEFACRDAGRRGQEVAGPSAEPNCLPRPHGPMAAPPREGMAQRRQLDPRKPVCPESEPRREVEEVLRNLHRRPLGHFLVPTPRLSCAQQKTSRGVIKVYVCGPRKSSRLTSSVPWSLPTGHPRVSASSYLPFSLSFLLFFVYLTFSQTNPPAPLRFS